MFDLHYPNQQVQCATASLAFHSSTGSKAATNPFGLVTRLLLIHLFANAFRVEHHPLGELLKYLNLDTES
jgi:hypothetical protein